MCRHVRHLLAVGCKQQLLTDAPVFTIACCLQGQAYTDAGANAYDAVDGAITAIITSGLTAVNSMVVS